MQVCTHTNDKNYSLSTELTNSFSSVDFSAHIKHSVKYNSDALGKSIWSGDEPVYWSLDSDYEWLSHNELKKIIKSAFLEPSFETPLIIRNRKESDAQIRIKFLGQKDEKYFTSPSILAFAWGPGGGVGGDITMNADNLWLTRNTPLTALEAKELGYIDNFQFPNNTIKFYDPIHTLKHEGGHALGMNHITLETLRYKSVMFPYYNGLRMFGDADLEYLHRLYGDSSLPHWFKEQIRYRIGI